MHELGIVFEVVKVVEQVAKEQKLPSVDTIVLQVGELCGVIPVYLDECWPAAIDKNRILKYEIKARCCAGRGKVPPMRRSVQRNCKRGILSQMPFV